MQIAILGAGNVGVTLGKGWQKAGHTVIYGTREPSQTKFDDLNGASVAGFADAVKDADVVAITLPFAAIYDVLPTLGDLSDKVIIDITNPVKADFSGLEPLEGSSSHEVAKLLHSNKVVKAFNTVGFNVMADP